MRARLKRFHGELIRRVRYRITKGGVLFTLAVILVGVAAVVSANNLLFLILATMISPILVSGLISRLCLAGLELDLFIPEHVTAGRAVPAKLYVRNLKFWMPSFSIRLVGIEDKHPLTSSIYFPVIPGGALLEETVEVRLPLRGAPAEMADWFERAVDCCAFLCWRLSQRSTGIHLRSQDFTFRLPEEGDIYTILKYLALVECQAGKAAEPPIDEHSFQIVFSAAPDRFAQAGWRRAHLLGPGDLTSSAGGAAGEARAG